MSHTTALSRYPFLACADCELITMPSTLAAPPPLKAPLMGNGLAIVEDQLVVRKVCGGFARTQVFKDPRREQAYFEWLVGYRTNVAIVMSVYFVVRHLTLLVVASGRNPAVEASLTEIGNNYTSIDCALPVFFGLLTFAHFTQFLTFAVFTALLIVWKRRRKRLLSLCLLYTSPSPRDRG